MTTNFFIVVQVLILPVLYFLSNFRSIREKSANISYGNARDKTIYVLLKENSFFYYLSNVKTLKAWVGKIYPARKIREWSEWNPWSMPQEWAAVIWHVQIYSDPLICLTQAIMLSQNCTPANGEAILMISPHNKWHSAFDHDWSLEERT